MTKQIIAIGGGGFGRDPGKGIIENYILEQAETKKPNICFIPTATGAREEYKENYYSTFSKLNCNPTHLDFFKRTPDLEGLIEDQQVIFVGGGNTKSMLAVWLDWGLDIYLKEAYERGVVMSGVSAGAICWYEKGIIDSWSNDLRIMDCLGFVKGNCCPHYDEEPERRPTVAKFLSEQLLDSCLTIEGESALHMKDGKVFSSIAFRKGDIKNDIDIENKEIIETPFDSVDISSN
jgi:aminopeptidase N